MNDDNFAMFLVAGILILIMTAMISFGVQTRRIATDLAEQGYTLQRVEGTGLLDESRWQVVER